MKKILLFSFFLLLCNCREQPQTQPPHPDPENTPVPVAQLGPLTVCPNKTSFCYQGQQVWLRGASDYGAFSTRYDYSTFLAKMQSNRINLMREWVCPFPVGWGSQLLQPYTFQNGVPQLNEPFWKNADEFITLASQHGIWVQVDLTDRYGSEAKEFATNPMNVKMGGFLKVGLPELYQNPKVIDMAELGVRRLAKHQNVIFVIVNEPSKSSSVAELTDYHKKMTQMIRRVCGSTPLLVGVNQVPDQQGRPTLPNPREVGADFSTVHGASVENPKDRASCSPSQVAARLQFIQRLLQGPVLNDDDGLYAKNVPCNRYDHSVLKDLATGSLSFAGFNHRSSEPSSTDEPVDDVGLGILRDTHP